MSGVRRPSGLSRGVPRALLLWVAALAVLTAGCEGSAPSRSDIESVGTPSVRDSAGVEIVETPGAMARLPTGWVVHPDPEIEIGAVAGAPEYQFSQLRGTTRLSDGGLAVVNQGSSEVRVFGPDGLHRQTLGGRGDGPGELQLPALVRREGADSLLVYDSRLRRFTFFSPLDGGSSVVSGVRPGFGVPAAASAGRVLWAASVIPFDAIPGPFSVPVTYSILDLDSGGETVLVEFGGQRWFMALGLAELPTALALPFSVAPSASSGSAGHFLTEGTAPEIGFFDDSGRLGRILRILELPRPIPPEEHDRLIAALAEAMRPTTEEARRTGRRVYESMEAIPFLPSFDALLVDQVGWLWARLPHHATAEGWPEWMVFSPDGVARGTVALPPGLEVLEIGEDYILGGARDDLRVEYVKLHRLER